MANVDLEGLKRIPAKEIDNQHTGRGVRGFVHKMGTKGTGRVHGNGTEGGGVNRSTNSHPQN
jgi:hypothetical protein